jgi:hypothetical protein
MEENVKNNLKKKLKRNETTTDLSEFNISESNLEYVYKSLKHLPNIENLIWPSGYSQKDDLEPIEKLKNKVNKRLQTNRTMFKELKQELVKNDSTTDLRQFNDLALEDTEKFLLYVLKSLEMLKNITAIEWPDVCLSLSEKTQKNLLEKIEERVDENRKRKSKNKLDNEVERKLRKKLKSNEAHIDLSEFEMNDAILNVALDALQSSHLPNIENIKWSTNSTSNSNEPLQEQLSKILSKRKEKFKEIKEKLTKNETQIDLSETLILDEDIEMFLVYILKSLEKLSNITKIKWPKNCITLKIEKQQDLMEKINEKLSSNLKNHLDMNRELLMRHEQGEGRNVEDGKNSRKKLIEKIKHYEKFPNDYRYCVFSRHVYLYGGKATLEENKKELRVIDETATNHLKENFTKLYEDGWRVDQVQIENGFKSVLYINETRKQLVLAFKGVQLELRDLFLEGEFFLIKKWLKVVSLIIKKRLVESAVKFS